MECEHPNISCDVCHASPIVGVRYKCANCLDYDLCQICESRNAHDPTHLFLKIKQPLPTVIQKVLIPYSLYNMSVPQSPFMGSPSLMQSTRSFPPLPKEKEVPMQLVSPKFPTLPMMPFFGSQSQQLSSSSGHPALSASSTGVPSPLLKFLPSMKGSGGLKRSGGGGSMKDREVAKACNDFGFRLLRAAQEGEDPHENLCISPFVVSLSLMLAANGAIGETYLEIVRTLGYGAGDLHTLNTSLRNYCAALRNDEADIHFANSLWTAKDLEVKLPYAQALSEFYNAECLTPIDPASANTWAATKTYNKIFDLALPDDPSICSTLADVDPSGVKVVALPYRGNTRAVIVLPPESQSAASYISTLDSTTWQRMLGSLHHKEGTIVMPRFRLESVFSLRDILEQLGVRRSFMQDAQFSNAANEPLWLDDVVHAASVDCDEKGLEPAYISTSTPKKITYECNPAVYFFHL